jgi:hypothetical protein
MHFKTKEGMHPGVKNITTSQWCLQDLYTRQQHPITDSNICSKLLLGRSVIFFFGMKKQKRRACHAFF